MGHLTPPLDTCAVHSHHFSHVHPKKNLGSTPQGMECICSHPKTTWTTVVSLHRIPHLRKRVGKGEKGWCICLVVYTDVCKWLCGIVGKILIEGSKKWLAAALLLDLMEILPSMPESVKAM